MGDARLKILTPEQMVLSRGDPVDPDTLETARKIVDDVRRGGEAALRKHAVRFGDLEDPTSRVRALLKSNYTIRRKQGLGTEPSVYYIV